MPNLAHYMAQYDHEHGSASNKMLHGVGIPMIFVGIILLLLMKWVWGAAFFLGGWVLLFLGHRGRKSSSVFSGTDLFAGWANLGRKRSLDVSDGNAPQTSPGRCHGEHRQEIVRRRLWIARERITLRDGGGLHE